MALPGQRFEIDPETLLDLREMGLTDSQIGKEVGCSAQTISRRIADIQANQSILLQYRQLQSLQLTELQARVLEAITPGKIEEAPLRDLVLAFKILKDKELTIEGKPSDIKGLVAYLIELEKEEAALKEPLAIDPGDFEEGEFEEVDITNPNYVPKL